MKRALFLLGTAFAFAFFSPLLRAGNGKIDVNSKTLDLTMLFLYAETDDNLDGGTAKTWRQVFNEGSKRLWNATNGQLRIGKVTVYARALDKKNDADVWISKVGGQLGNVAYTTSVGSLGVPGQHMQFNQRNHLLRADYLGDCSIAHEIGHYALNLYDEYLGGSVLIAKKDHFSRADIIDVNPPTPFIYSINDSNTIASLMDSGGSVAGKNLRTEFDTADNVVKGVAAPNGEWYMSKQWIERRESCWETMSKIEVNGVKLFTDIPTGDSPNNPPPGFVDIEWEKIPSLSRVVLCIDQSESMATNSKMGLAIAGARIFSNLTEAAHEVVAYDTLNREEDHFTVEGDRLGIVSFNDGVSTLLPLTEVDGAGQVKADATTAVGALSANGGTALGDGINQALGLITGAGAKSSQEAIIVLSDGDDTASIIKPAEAAANCLARGARVFSVVVGAGGSGNTLAAIANLTGGKFYQATDASALLAIYPSILAQLRGGALVNSTYNIAGESESSSVSTPVDGFSEETIFSLANVSPGYQYSIKSPKGKVYTGSVPEDGVVFEQSADETHFRVQHAAVGQWQQLVTTPHGLPGVHFRYALTNASATQKVNVITSTTQSTYAAPDPIVVRCTVTAGDPVAGAEVQGVITGPDGFLSYVTLFDDGAAAHGDTTEGDGVYSAAFQPDGGSGVYTIDVNVVNKTGQQAISTPELTGTKFVPQSIVAFQRSSTVTVQVTGAVAAAKDWFRVDALSIAKDKKNPGFGTVTMTAEINAPVGQLQPLTDTMNVVFGTRFFQITPGALTATNTPGVYKILKKDYSLSGTLMIETGGSSRGKLMVTKKNFDLSGTPFAATLDVKILSGRFQEAVTIQPVLSPTPAPTKLTYLSKKNFANTPTLFFDGIKATVNHAAANKDTLRIVSTFEGGGADYDPATQDADLSLGSFALHLPAGALVKKKQISKGKVAIGAGSAQITIDLSKHTLLLNGSKLALNGELGRTMSTALDMGSFEQTGVLTVKQTTKKGAETLLY